MILTLKGARTVFLKLYEVACTPQQQTSIEVEGAMFLIVHRETDDLIQIQMDTDEQSVLIYLHSYQLRRMCLTVLGYLEQVIK